MIPTDGRHIALAVLVVLAVLGVIAVVRSTRRQSHEAVRTLYCAGAPVGLAGRSLLTGALIVGVQWLVITHTTAHQVGYWVTLAVPAWLAGYTITRWFTVTTIAGRGGGWR
jgi:hypothetical protein